MTYSELTKLKSFSDNAWYSLLLRRDPLFDKLEKERELEVIEKAKQRGLVLAERWLESSEANTCNTDRLQADGVVINRLERAQLPPMVVFAAFKSYPTQIDVYMPAIRMAVEQLRVHDAWEDGTVPDVDSVTDLVIAHETFHYLDELFQKDRYTEQVKYKVGFFNRNATLKSTDEVSATVFAQVIADPPYNPGLLDVALLSAYQKKKENYAALFIKALEEISEVII